MARTRRWHYPDRNQKPARPGNAPNYHAVGMFEEPTSGGVAWQPFSALLWGTGGSVSAPAPLVAQAPAVPTLAQQNADLTNSLTQLQSVDNDGVISEHSSLAGQLEAALLPPAEQPAELSCTPVLRRRRGIEI